MYVAVVGDYTGFQPNRSRSTSEITDGTSNTVMVVEVPASQGVHWMSPEDIDVAQFAALTEHKDTHHTGGGHALLADGSVRFLAASLDAKTRVALSTVDGQESVGEF